MAEQLSLDFDQRPAMGRDDFLVADENRDAVAWLDRWPDWPAPVLTVFGPPGSGKTHLARVWSAQVERTGGAVLPLTADMLEPDGGSDGVAADSTCLLEDADALIAGHAGRERSLFHLYNHLAGGRGHMLLTARDAPAIWTVQLPDLRSRVVAAPAVALKAPDDPLIAAVLVKLFADRQLRVSQDVILYLLGRMERSLSAARDIVAALDAAALAGRRNITVPLARDVLGGDTSQVTNTP